METLVRDNPDEQRYELLSDGELVGELVYRLRDSRISLLHTEVSPSVEGQGLGGRLVAGALDDIRARGLRVVPVCPFVRAYLRRHPDAADLVAV
jgi:predicted GNAT family acetyltransferase